MFTQDSPHTTCYLIPRRDLTPKQFKELGKAINGWTEELDTSLKLVHGTDDLAKGEPPMPKPIQMANFQSIEWIQEDMDTLARASSLRGVYVLLQPFYGLPEDVIAQQMESLEPEELSRTMREKLPVELLEDVLINGISWN